MTITSETDRVIGRLRQEVCDLHAQLTRYDLVIWTAGNVSARVPDRDLMVIKPSGADYDSLTADDIVVCDLHGNLVDGDLASNAHGWQWVAGTGTDAAPYHRIFNPTLQGKRFDPDGEYVRRWVPELAGIDGPAIHEPWKLTEPTPGYPDPIVDHADARREALDRYDAVRAG